MFIVQATVKPFDYYLDTVQTFVQSALLTRVPACENYHPRIAGRLL
jgi:hypothetical protein